MISKVLPADSVYHTCRYICNKSDAEVLASDGVRDHNFKLMAEDFVRQQQLRPGKGKAFFHGIVSFHPSEKLSDETLSTIANQYLERLGIMNTQYAVVKHNDRAHAHLHIVANLVNNDGKVIKDNYLGLRGKKVAQQLTQEYNLIPAIKKEMAITNLENMNEQEVARYKIYAAIATALPGCNSMDMLVSKLRKQEIETQFKYKGQTQEVQGVSFKTGKFCFKGSKVDRKFSFAGIQKAIMQANTQSVTVTEQTEKTLKTQKHKETFQQILSAQKSDSEKFIPAAIGLENAREVFKMLNTVVGELLKPEQVDGAIPYELSQEKHLRKKKKHRHKL